MSELFSALKGYCATAILCDLYSKGVIDEFRNPQSHKVVANKYGMEPERLDAVLRFLTKTTDIIEIDGERYNISSQYTQYESFGFHLEKFLFAYGSFLSSVYLSLQCEPEEKPTIDREAFSKAFSKVRVSGDAILVELVSKWKIQTVLDLGCGPGGFLVELCRQNESLKGIGIDKALDMCEAAEGRIRDCDLSSRLRIRCGDVSELDTLISGEDREGIDALFGRSIVNEFFGDGENRAISFLRQLGRLFPGRLFFVVDYFGKLLCDDIDSDLWAHSLLHDLIQVLSGQGVPPSNHEGWSRLYDAAGSELLEAYQGESNGIEWFMHVIRLP